MIAVELFVIVELGLGYKYPPLHDVCALPIRVHTSLGRCVLVPSAHTSHVGRCGLGARAHTMSG